MKTVLLFLLLYVYVNAQTIYVNSATGNDATGDGSSGNPYNTFHAGYTAVSSGGTLDLTGTFTWTDADETGDAATTGYTIAKSITIQGQSTTLTIIQAASSAGSADRRIFSVSPELTVTFRNLELRYGNVTANDGGALYFNNGTTGNSTVENCYVHDNIGRQAGGITSFSGTVNIINTTVANNSSGNGVGLDGGGILKNGGVLIITNSTVHNNVCPTQFGGGLSLRGGTTIITNCTITSNTSQGEGGGINMEGATGNVIVKNTIIANNTSSANPSASDFDRYEGTLTDNGYNIVELTNAAFSGTGTITGDQANLFGTGVSSTPSLALNSSTNGTPTLKTLAGSVAINAGNSSANGSVSVPAADQRGASRNGTTDIGAYEYYDDGGSLPVELSSFTANISGSSVLLKWQTASEVNNYGFEIERASTSAASGQGWEKIGFVKGSGNSNSDRNYSFTDKNISGGKIFYRLKQLDTDGKYEYSKEIEVDVNAAPLEFNLAQNYPNPFNPETMIDFTVPADGQATLEIFNALGEKVAVLFNEFAETGKYHQVRFNASNLATGIYIAKLQYGNTGEGAIKQMTRKLLLVK